jgi:hypothetical protein
MMRRCLAAGAVGCLLALAGCGEGGSSMEDGPMVTDSAGIRIVSHRPLAERILEPHPEAMVVLGGGEGADEALFQVRAAFLEPSGGIVLADAGSRQLRHYDAEGRLVHAFGGQGSGPGEFQAVTAVQRVGGGRIAVRDGSLNRVTVFDDGGAVVHTFTTELGPPDPRSAVVIPGTVLWVSEGGDVVGISSPTVLLEGRDREFPVMGPLRLYPASGEATELGEVELSRLRETPGGDTPFPVRPVPGAAAPRAHADADRLALTSADRHLVRVFDRGRESMPIIEARERRSSAEDPALTEVEYLPPYASVLVDGAGRIWVASPTAPADTTTEWRLFDATGLYVATLPLPPRARLLDAAEDEILVLLFDELDVETVQRLRVPGLGD